jgi:hypothetical protein
MQRHRMWMSLAAIAIAALIARPAHAQIESGDRAISVFGSLSFSGGSGGQGSTTSGSLFGSVQYFISRQFALRVNVSEFITTSTSSDPFSGQQTNNTLTSTEVGGGLEYDFQFAENRTVPYLAFDVATSASGSGPSTALLSPSAGIRFFMNRNTAFNVAGVYQESTTAGAPATVLLQFGLSVFFGGDKRK